MTPTKNKLPIKSGFLILCVTAAALNVLVFLVGSAFFSTEIFYEPDVFEFSYTKYLRYGRITCEIGEYMLFFVTIPLAVSALIFLLVKKLGKQRCGKLLTVLFCSVGFAAAFLGINYWHLDNYFEAKRLVETSSVIDSSSELKRFGKVEKIYTNGNAEIYLFENWHGALIESPEKPTDKTMSGQLGIWVFVKLSDNRYFARMVLDRPE